MVRLSLLKTGGINQITINIERQSYGESDAFSTSVKIAGIIEIPYPVTLQGLHTYIRTRRIYLQHPTLDLREMVRRELLYPRYQPSTLNQQVINVTAQNASR